MDKRVESLIGSPSRDDFKHRHKKRLKQTCYAVDIDLAWVGKKRVLCFFDYKKPGDRVNKNEEIAYKDLSHKAPFIVLTELDVDKFSARICIDGEWYMYDGEVTWDTLASWREILERKESLI